MVQQQQEQLSGNNEEVEARDIPPKSLHSIKAQASRGRRRGNKTKERHGNQTSQKNDDSKVVGTQRSISMPLISPRGATLGSEAKSGLKKAAIVPSVQNSPTTSCPSLSRSKGGATSLPGTPLQKTKGRQTVSEKSGPNSSANLNSMPAVTQVAAVDVLSNLQVTKPTVRSASASVKVHGARSASIPRCISSSPRLPAPARSSSPVKQVNNGPRRTQRSQSLSPSKRGDKDGSAANEALPRSSYSVNYEAAWQRFVLARERARRINAQLAKAEDEAFNAALKKLTALRELSKGTSSSRVSITMTGASMLPDDRSTPHVDSALGVTSVVDETQGEGSAKGEKSEQQKSVSSAQVMMQAVYSGI